MKSSLQSIRAKLKDGEWEKFNLPDDLSIGNVSAVVQAIQRRLLRDPKDTKRYRIILQVGRYEETVDLPRSQNQWGGVLSKGILCVHRNAVEKQQGRVSAFA